MAAITRSIWVPPRAGRPASSCTVSIPDGLPGRTTPTRTIKRVADSLAVDPARLRLLFQGVRDQAQSGTNTARFLGNWGWWRGAQAHPNRTRREAQYPSGSSTICPAGRGKGLFSHAEVLRYR